MPLHLEVKTELPEVNPDVGSSFAPSAATPRLSGGGDEEVQ